MNTQQKEVLDNKHVKLPEGVDKAALRAQRKEAKKQNKKKDSQNKIENPPSKKDQLPAQIKSNKPVTQVEKVESNKIVEETKSELKAQRRAAQGATTEKVADIPSNLEIKCDSKTIEKNESNVTKSNETTESKADLRAKRRAIQEAQRLAKLQAQETTQKSKKINEKSKEVPKIKRIATRKDSISVVTGGNFQKQVQLFNHLYFHHSTSVTKDSSTITGLHSSIIRLGLRYLSHNILGSNARCLALLFAIKSLINDYKTPFQQEFCRSLESNLQASTNYLQKCRPLAVSMINAVRHIKWQLTQMPTNLPDSEKKSLLLEGIDTYINDEIGMADKAISMTVQAKVNEGDVILTYGCSSIVSEILLDAHRSGKIFSVVVVDARPLLEGRELLRKLVNSGISCTYVLINAVSFIMGRVTKVLLGAHSLLANGYVMSRAGTAQVALIAQAFNKPVLVCCETYKFCERVQTDSIVHNEIGDPDKLVLHNMLNEKSPISNWKENKFVTPLNLMYDVTPPDLVTAVVTELAILPCTSVPVILRIKPNEITV